MFVLLVTSPQSSSYLYKRPSARATALVETSIPLFEIVKERKRKKKERKCERTGKGENEIKGPRVSLSDKQRLEEGKGVVATDEDDDDGVAVTSGLKERGLRSAWG